MGHYNSYNAVLKKHGGTRGGAALVVTGFEGDIKSCAFYIATGRF
jgi:hypothetical protein